MISEEVEEVRDEFRRSYWAMDEATGEMDFDTVDAVESAWRSGWRKRPDDLDFLVKDPDPAIRIWVADIGREQDLDVLVEDPDWMVRMAVAGQGRKQDLDILVKDPDWHVRWRVAMMGRPEDRQKLAGDPVLVVRQAVGE
ncbi:HEAT repeat domain-containing protein [Lactobacillus delbrueckii subsp. bulgaricus]